MAERLSLLALWQVFQLFWWVLNWSLKTSVMEKHSVCVWWLVESSPASHRSSSSRAQPPPPRPPPVTVLSHDCAHMTGIHTHTLQSYMCMCLFDKADGLLLLQVGLFWMKCAFGRAFFFFHSFIQACSSWKNTHLLKCFWGWLSWWVTHYLMTWIKQPVFSEHVIRMILFSVFLMFLIFFAPKAQAGLHFFNSFYDD